MRRYVQLALFLAAAALALVGVAVGLHATDTDPLPAAPPSVAAPRAASAADTGPRGIGRPTRVVIPAIKVDEGLTGLGLETDGTMTMPAYGSAGWYDEGPRPGSPGPAVVVAHVRGPAGPDVFWDLATLTAGDLVSVEGSRGRVAFEVVSVETVAKDALPYDRIWPDTEEPLLRLITCGGEPLPGGGFPANTVVYARLA